MHLLISLCEIAWPKWLKKSRKQMLSIVAGDVFLTNNVTKIIFAKTSPNQRLKC